MKRIQIENRTELAKEIPLESPYCIFIDPSSICNFKCKFCMNHKIKNPGIMSFDTYKKIINSLKEFENPVKTIRLYGFGEPLLNKHFADMVKYAKQSNKVLNVDTTTNGSLFTYDLSRKIIEAGIDRINISINGLSSKQYKEFTGKDINFDQMVENLTFLYSIKKKTTIFIKINGDYLTSVEKQKFFNIFKPISDGCDIEHTAECWYDTEIENVNKEVGVYGQPLDNMKVCPYPLYSFTIHADGQAVICFLDWNKKIPIGNIKQNSVKEIWNGPKLKKLQIMMLEQKRENHPICKNCKQLIFGMAVNLDEHSTEILKKMEIKK